MLSVSSSILRSRVGTLAHVTKAGINSLSTRSISVFTLSDESAIEKFKTMNDKSILYFTATWCPPCKAIKPVYEKLAKEYPEVAFGKIDIDDNQETAAEVEVSRQYPSMWITNAGRMLNVDSPIATHLVWSYKPLFSHYSNSHFPSPDISCSNVCII